MKTWNFEHNQAAAKRRKGTMVESVVSRRLWLGLIASLVLAFLLAMTLAPWAQLLIQPDQPHMHSPIASDNSRDISRLDTNAVGVQDSVIQICDHSTNDKKALGRGFNNGNVFISRTDEDGAGGSCFGLSSGTNGEAHDACNWHVGPSGCGPNSHHPG